MLLADQVEDVADQRVRRADVAGRDQLHRADALVRRRSGGPGCARRRPAEADRPERVQVGHRRATSALHGSCTWSQSKTRFASLRRRRDAADLIQRPPLERVHRLAATRRSGLRGERAEVPEGVEERGARRRWPRRPPVAGQGRRCRGSAAWPGSFSHPPWRDPCAVLGARRVRRGAARGWCPSRSSKPVSRRSPAVGRFDSCAAPLCPAATESPISRGVVRSLDPSASHRVYSQSVFRLTA